MPLPTPSEGQSEKEFMAVCMGNSVMNKEFPKRDQRFAVCKNQYKKKNSEHVADYTADSVNIFVPILRSFETKDGRKLLYGYAAIFDSPDAFKTVISRELVEESLERLRKYPAFRYMHRNPLGRILFDEEVTTPEGKTVSTFVDNHGFHVLAQVNDHCEKEWSFIKEGGWGFSYGLMPRKIEKRRFNDEFFDVFVEGDLYEVSAVDTPAHEGATINIVNRRLLSPTNHSDNVGGHSDAFSLGITAVNTDSLKHKGEKINMEKEEVEQMLQDSEERIMNAVKKAVEGKEASFNVKSELEAFEKRILETVQDTLSKVPKKDDIVKKSLENFESRFTTIDGEIEKFRSVADQMKAIGEDPSHIEERIKALETTKTELMKTVERGFEGVDKRLKTLENEPAYNSPQSQGAKTVTREFPMGFRATLDKIGETA